jgi:hypothetical protein
MSVLAIVGVTVCAWLYVNGIVVALLALRRSPVRIGFRLGLALVWPIWAVIVGRALSMPAAGDAK